MIAARQIAAREFHYHKCPGCDYIWGHYQLPSPITKSQWKVYNAAHKCPKCGSDDRWRRDLNGNPIQNMEALIVVVESLIWEA